MNTTKIDFINSVCLAFSSLVTLAIVSKTQSDLVLLFSPVIFIILLIILVVVANYTVGFAEGLIEGLLKRLED